MIHISTNFYILAFWIGFRERKKNNTEQPRNQIRALIILFITLRAIDKSVLIKLNHFFLVRCCSSSFLFIQLCGGLEYFSCVCTGIKAKVVGIFWHLDPIDERQKKKNVVLISFLASKESVEQCTKWTATEACIVRSYKSYFQLETGALQIQAKILNKSKKKDPYFVSRVDMKRRICNLYTNL